MSDTFFEDTTMSLNREELALLRESLLATVTLDRNNALDLLDMLGIKQTTNLDEEQLKMFVRRYYYGLQ